MNVDGCEQLEMMLREVWHHHRRHPGGSLKRILPTVEHHIAEKWALSRQTIANRWTSEIGLEGNARKAELRELINDWLNGAPGPLFGQILPHVPAMFKDKLRQLLFEELSENADSSNDKMPEARQSETLAGEFHLPARELGAISIQAGKLGVSIWKFVELLVMREARKALEKFEAVADVEGIDTDETYPLHGAPFEYVDPTKPVGVEDWEALK